MEERIKQRVVGAIVLVSLAVVIVPMLLDAPLDVQEEAYTNPLPDRPQGEFDSSLSVTRGEPETPRLDAEVERDRGQRGQDAVAAGGGGSSTPVAGGSDELPVVVSRRAPEPTESGVSRAQPIRSSAPGDPFPPARAPGGGSGGTEPTAARSGGWTVQLGSFQKSDNADALLQRLRSKGYEAFVEPGTSPQGEVHRVFVGDSLDREQAGRSAAMLQRELKLEGIVVRHTGG